MMTKQMMTNHPAKDYRLKAANYLTALGCLNLLGLNLGGLVWLWFAAKLRERNEKFRRASLALLGLHVLVLGVFVLMMRMLYPNDPPTLQGFGAQLPWGSVIVGRIAMVMAAIHLPPIFWLLAPGTRAAFKLSPEPAVCVRCGAQQAAWRCPHCGELRV